MIIKYTKKDVIQVLAQYIANKYQDADFIRIIPKEDGSFDILTSKKDLDNN